MKIKIVNVSKEYITGWPALPQVSFDVEKEPLALMGLRGDGKTTLMRIMVGLEKKFKGDVLFDGKSIRNIEQKELDGLYITSQYMLEKNKTVIDNIMYGIKIRNLPNGEELASYAINLCHLQDVQNTKAKNLSLEQQFFVSLARGLARKPQFIILDDCFVQFEIEHAVDIMRRIIEILNNFDVPKIITTESLEIGELFSYRLVLE